MNIKLIVRKHYRQNVRIILKIPKRVNQKSLIEGHTNTMIQRTKESTNNDLQNTTQKIKDRATRTSLKQGDELRYAEREAPSVTPKQI